MPKSYEYSLPLTEYKKTLGGIGYRFKNLKGRYGGYALDFNSTFIVTD